MENLDLLNNDLQVTPQAQSYLTESAKWGKFLAIVGFIFCGLFVIIALFSPINLQYNNISEEYSPTVKVVVRFIIFVLAVLFFFPSYFLNRFSLKMQNAVKFVSQENFDESLMNLKSMFKFYAILYIIILSFYALIFILAIIAVAIR